MLKTLLDVINILGTFYIGIIIVRFILQMSKADFYNPISQFVVKTTNPLLIPLRRLIPGWKGFDIASIILALLLQIVLIMIVKQVPVSFILAQFGTIFAISLFNLLLLVLNIYKWSVFIMIIISWVSPGTYHPGIQLLNQITEPALKPFRSLIPSIGGLDLSPMVFLLLLFIIESLLKTTIG